ncbi:type VII secretion target [Nocardia sp. NPDC049220]|uniref:type VII secretion target n=1 Tax=Nocardia sp. NPDC049220 TaxID=3155273 RepID=UPI0033CDC2BC
METLRLDPAAVAAYTTIADAVSRQLASAAEVTSGAVDPDQLAADLGLVGAEFAARFATAVSEHAQALSTAGQLVGTYGQVLRMYSENAQRVDTDTAGAIDQAGEAPA